MGEISNCIDKAAAAYAARDVESLRTILIIC